MVHYIERLENAKKSLKVADHMLTITHNVVNDPKLLVLVLQKLENALNNIMAAVLHYELYYHRIPKFEESFKAMFDIFKVRCIRRYNLDASYIELINETYNTLKQQKEGPVGFARKGKYVICSDNYEMKVLTKESLAKYVQKTKLFIKDVEKMITK
ncbi:hypothetical protein HN695_01840 [Candidatus Woesearchaeota archaeon]|jgi:hypothetical protein|nr:hypothetical protein [Candidatus Woesearchaeota archaeon]MBT5273140.1 hypothetical protein [Candidatus Woesearchaeota archaeon]MBT6041627.1 hypothetical protein [Candidatus Woesearchaeota archaeon]MBT6337545.1 hypothetical protein [Candidatus Woesearchaeota archaeon]MBT7927054.1 hypothetical protein [Candidatus Woesearchaeota archaeon]